MDNINCNSIMYYAIETIERIHDLPSGGIKDAATLRVKKKLLLDHINSVLSSKYNLLTMSNWLTGNKNVPVKVIVVLQEFIFKHECSKGLSVHSAKQASKKIFGNDEVARIKNIS